MYHTKPTKPSLPNQTYQTKPNPPNQTDQTKPNLPNQTYQNKSNIAYHDQAYWTKPTKPKSLAKAVNGWIRSAFSNVYSVLYFNISILYLTLTYQWFSTFL